MIKKIRPPFNRVLDPSLSGWLCVVSVSGLMSRYLHLRITLILDFILGLTHLYKTGL